MAGLVSFVIKSIERMVKSIGFATESVDFAMQPTNFVIELIDFVAKSIDFTVKLMDFVIKSVDFFMGKGGTEGDATGVYGRYSLASGASTKGNSHKKTQRGRSAKILYGHEKHKNAQKKAFDFCVFLRFWWLNSSD
uniref:Uncharacterized protein n=1 Tax=Candidatus Kentrum sp. TUN TaxID=2126343 RepID=A0A450ZB72_9GAMM|nr:MAG: hypothetical protein BECKTUN1418D_GA0071000_100322 [Candidatus Kentron sp. TUN]